MKKGHTRKGNPCMRHYQGLKRLKDNIKAGKDIRAICFQDGIVLVRILDDENLTEQERTKLLNRYHDIQVRYDLFWD